MTPRLSVPDPIQRAVHSALLIIDATHGTGSRDSPLAEWMNREGIDATYFFDQLEAVVVPNQLRLLEAARSTGATVVFTRPLIAMDDAGDWPAGYRARIAAMAIAPSRPGTRSYELLPQFTLEQTDFVVDKLSISAFHAGTLGALLRARGVEHVYVTGSTTNYGVGVNAVDAANLGYCAAVVTDASTAFSEEIHRSWLATHDLLVRPVTTDGVIAELTRP
jgi:nicotinamidase-related amidase